MRLFCRVLLTAIFLATGVLHGHAHTDMSKVTCSDFLASGQANMAAIIMWLRGYHAGKRGVIDVIEKPPADPYGGKARPLLQGSPAGKRDRRLRADLVGPRSQHLIHQASRQGRACRALAQAGSCFCTSASAWRWTTRLPSPAAGRFGSRSVP